MATTNKITTSATTNIFNVVSKATLDREQRNEIFVLKELKEFFEKSEIRNTNSTTVCIKTHKKLYSYTVNKIFEESLIHIGYSWTSDNYLYLILDKEDFGKIGSLYQERFDSFKLPSFETEDGSIIFGFEISEVNTNTLPHILFGDKIANILSLFFKDNIYKEFKITPIRYIDNDLKEKFIKVYDDIDFYNEKILHKTILRSTEELFNEEDDEDPWI